LRGEYISRRLKSDPKTVTPLCFLSPFPDYFSPLGLVLLQLHQSPLPDWKILLYAAEADDEHLGAFLRSHTILCPSLYTKQKNPVSRHSTYKSLKTHIGYFSRNEHFWLVKSSQNEEFSAPKLISSRFQFIKHVNIVQA
jgi:hypothetical protein